MLLYLGLVRLQETSLILYILLQNPLIKPSDAAVPEFSEVARDLLVSLHPTTEFSYKTFRCCCT
jgi:hypothetical protein